MRLEEAIKIIRETELDFEAGVKAKEYQDSLIKPRGSLGKLEEISIRLAQITGQVKYNITNKSVILLCGDHGVANENISAYPKDVTKHMTRQYIVGGAGANVIANANGADVAAVIDLGIDGVVDIDGLIIRKLGNGTNNFTQGPAMTEEQAIKAIEIGIEETFKVIDKGAQIIAPGEMGIGNTTSSSALLAAYGQFTPEEVVGRGSLINDETLQRKINCVKRGLEVNKPYIGDPLAILAALGGFEIAGIVGVYMACAVRRVPVVVDGFIASAGAVAAKFIAPGVEKYMFGSHLSQEPAHKKMLKLLGLEPLFDLNLRLGEATGASIAMSIIQTASKVICEMATFTSGNVAEAKEELELGWKKRLH